MNIDRRGERFFLVMGIVLLGTVIAGFLPPALSRPGGIASVPLLLHVHGAAFIGWFMLFCLQARLVGIANLRLHKRLGQLSLVLVGAMLILGFLVIRSALAKPEFSIAGMTPAASVMFPFTDLVNLSIAYALALHNRKNPAAHKRLMLLAGILIIDPAVARLVFTLGAPPPVILLIELGFFAALIGYDIRTRRRPHWASLLGLGLFAAAMLCKLLVAKQSWWAVFVYRAFG